jgi:hypothetical protein
MASPASNDASEEAIEKIEAILAALPAENRTQVIESTTQVASHAMVTALSRGPRPLGIRVNSQTFTIDYVLNGSVSTIWDVDELFTVDASLDSTLMLELKENGVFQDTNGSGCGFDGDKLLRHVQKQHGGVEMEWFKMAAKRIQEKPLKIRNEGEMILQQYLYSAFSMLLHSMNQEGYLADQKVKWTCGLPVQLDDKVAGALACRVRSLPTHLHMGLCLPCSSVRWKSNPSKQDKLLPWVSMQEVI